MADFFTVLVLLLLMHILCDFYLQPLHWVKAKKAQTYRSPQLYFHSLLHGVAILIPAFVLGIAWQVAACWVGIVAVSHFIIDLWKVTTPNSESFSAFLIDQALHVLVLAAIAVYLTGGVTVDALLQHPKFADALIVLFGYLLILKPTSIVIGSILKKYPISGGNAGSQVSGIVAGGEFIGYLERLLILTFTLVGSYEAVGFVLAAKSIFRFGELNKSKDRSMTEYVLIGSLVSVVITTMVGTLLALGLDLKVN